MGTCTDRHTPDDYLRDWMPHLSQLHPLLASKPAIYQRHLHTSWRSEHVQDTFAKHAVGSIQVFRRLIRFSLVGLIATGLTAWTAFEGVHMWVEKVELSPEQDEETRRWEWDREAENWPRSDTGGTDSALGFKGRHAVRSAWIAQNWGTGTGTGIIGPRTDWAGGLNLVDSQLHHAQRFLGVAISAAEKKSSSGHLHPFTLARLLSQHASILERIGSPNALSESRSQYERAWAGLPGKGVSSARVALKLGDLNHQLGDNEDAVAWWARAIQLSRDTKENQPASTSPAVPQEAPSSPLSQRTLTSTLVSLSAFYATSGQLPQAQGIQEASLQLLRSIHLPDSPTSPQTLHALYLLHRSSLISIHLAEVLFALHKPAATSIDWLTGAAQSSERVALALMGLSGTHNGTESKIVPPSPKTPLLPVYSKSRSMHKPAESLLRNARRSAMECWSLLGILNEKAGDSKPEKVLECYERALRWAGVELEGNWAPGEGTLESEWKILWANYVRAQGAVRDSTAKP